MSAEARNKAARTIQAALRKISGGLYTNSANGFKLSKPRVYLSSVKMSIGILDLEGLEKLADGRSFFVTQLDGLTAIRSKPVYRWVYKTGPTGDFSRATILRLSIIFKDPEATANVLIFKNGQIVINTTGPWERVARILAQEYLPGKITKMMDTAVVNANSSIFYCNRHIDTMELFYQIEALIPSSIATLTSLDPVQYMGSTKLPKNWLINPQRPFEDPRASQGFKRGFSVTMKNPNVSLFIFSNGTITASCLDPTDGPKAFKTIMSYMNKEVILGANRLVAGGNKKKAKLLAVTNARYERAPGWNATKNGFYVRPGPNGFPRFYPLVANKSLVRAKTIRAFLNSKIPIPASTRTMLNITQEHINAVANSENAHNHPKNFSNQSRAGYYVRPDKQGRPRWYKIPKGIANGKKTALAAYAKASVPVPEHIKTLFKIGNGNKAAVTTNHVINLGKNKSLRINGKQIERFNKDALLTIAANLNLPAVSNKMTIEQIRAEIQSKYAPKARPVNVVLNNVGHTLLANGTVRRNYKNKPSRTRQFSTLKVAEQNAIARALLNSNSYEKYKQILTKDRFSFLLGYRNAKAANEAAKRAVRPPPPNAPSPESPFNYRNELNFEYAVRLSNNLKNLYRNENTKEFINRLYAQLAFGSHGKFLKANVNKEYKKFVAEIKFLRGNMPLKAAYRSRIQVPNWVPANKANAFRNVLVNLAVMQKNGEWVYRSADDIKRGINAWIRTQLPQSPARAARVVENVITGERKTIPAYEPKPRSNVKIPTPPMTKAAPKPKPKPKPKTTTIKYTIPNRPELQNLRNALVNVGLYKNTYSWKELVEAGVNKKFKSAWDRYVKKN
jgi:hypothetical protein